MELLRFEQLKPLIEPTIGPCVSILIPTHRGGAEVRQGAIRLKNQARASEQQLSSQGMRASEIKSLLAPVVELSENSGFWQYQSDGLAVYCSPHKFLHYRVPLHLEELLVVTSRFHVKPLLRLFAEDGRFYVLALSKNDIRILQCTRYGAWEIGLPAGTPRRLADVLTMAGVQKQLQVHTAGGSVRFHGHGARAQDEKNDLREFFRQVDKGVRRVLRDDRAPMVLAGVEYLHSLYREVNTYPHLMAKGVYGNPDDRRPQDLQSNAWAIVEPHFRKAREEACRQFTEHAGGRRVSDDIRAVVPAAAQGRVEGAIVAVGRQIWGSWNETSFAVEKHDEKQVGDRDLLNLAAVLTLMHGGSVYAVPPEQVPGGRLLAALYRF